MYYFNYQALVHVRAPFLSKDFGLTLKSHGPLPICFINRILKIKEAKPCATDLVDSMVLTFLPSAPALLAAALAVVMGVQT